MPCYNEAATINEIVDAVLASAVVGELVIVDDCSTDGTSEAAGRDRRPAGPGRSSTRSTPAKARPLRTAFAAAARPLRRDPGRRPRVRPGRVPAAARRRSLDGRADVVFGSRFLSGDEHRVLYFWHTVGNRS